MLNKECRGRLRVRFGIEVIFIGIIIIFLTGGMKFLQAEIVGKAQLKEDSLAIKEKFVTSYQSSHALNANPERVQYQANHFAQSSSDRVGKVHAISLKKDGRYHKLHFSGSGIMKYTIDKPKDNHYTVTLKHTRLSPELENKIIHANLNSEGIHIQQKGHDLVITKKHHAPSILNTHVETVDDTNHVTVSFKPKAI